MSEYGKPQYAQVEQPSGCEPPILHCPICGAKTGRVEEEKGLVIDPCEHLAFSFSQKQGSFFFNLKVLQKKPRILTGKKYLTAISRKLLKKWDTTIGY